MRCFEGGFRVKKRREGEDVKIGVHTSRRRWRKKKKRSVEGDGDVSVEVEMGTEEGVVLMKEGGLREFMFHVQMSVHGFHMGLVPHKCRLPRVFAQKEKLNGKEIGGGNSISPAVQAVRFRSGRWMRM